MLQTRRHVLLAVRRVMYNIRSDTRPSRSGPAPGEPTSASRAGPARQPAAVCVRAPGRLHLGFLDPSATLGRPYGSLGLVIDGFETVIELHPATADMLQADTPQAQAELPRVQRHLEVLRRHSGVTAPLAVRLRKALPAHAGLGSGTQLALATGHAFASAFGFPWSAPQVARLLGRGQRSGIGVRGFDTGGFIVDGGPGAGDAPGMDAGAATPAAAPVLAWLPFPEAWRVVVIQDDRFSGLHGRAEQEALARLPPFTRAQAADLCHLVLMQLLPALAEGQFEPFASGLSAIQASIGQHFAPAQAGRAYTSPSVDRLMQWVAASGLPAGLGQSSWGPTAFAFVPSADAARQLIERARAAGAVDEPLRLQCARGRNSGAHLQWLGAAED